MTSLTSSDEMEESVSKAESEVGGEVKRSLLEMVETISKNKHATYFLYSSFHHLADELSLFSLV